MTAYTRLENYWEMWRQVSGTEKILPRDEETAHDLEDFGELRMVHINVDGPQKLTAHKS